MAQAVGKQGAQAAASCAPAVLLERAGAGCEESWQELVDRHLPLVHAICTGQGLDADAAAQVNQIVWLLLAENLPRIREPEALGGWIAATARVQCLAPRWAPSRSGYAAVTLGAADGGSPSGASPSTNGDPPSNGGQPPSNGGPSSDVAAAFVRVGAHCQRLLRLVAATPRPADDDVAAALDLSAPAVPETCAVCLQRLARLVGSGEEAVLTELRRLVAQGPGVPEGWRAAARVAFGWHLIAVPVAERVYESTRSAGLGMGSAAVGEGAGYLGLVHQGRFSCRRGSVEVAVEVKGTDVVMTAQLGSLEPTRVVAHWPGGERVGTTDDTGCVRFHDLPRSPLCVQVDGPSPFKTGWINP